MAGVASGAPINASERALIEASLSNLHDKAEVNRINNEKLLACVGQLKNAMTLSLSNRKEDALQELANFDDIPVAVKTTGKMSKKQEAVLSRQKLVEQVLGAKKSVEAEVTFENANPTPDDNTVVTGGKSKYVYGVKNGTAEMNKGVYVHYVDERFFFGKEAMKNALDEAVSSAGVDSIEQFQECGVDLEEALKNFAMCLVMGEIEDLPRPVYLECDVPKPLAGQDLPSTLNGLPEPVRSAFRQALETLPCTEFNEGELATMIGRAADDMRTDIDELRCNYPLMNVKGN